MRRMSLSLLIVALMAFAGMPTSQGSIDGPLVDTYGNVDFSEEDLDYQSVTVPEVFQVQSVEDPQAPTRLTDRTYTNLHLEGAATTNVPGKPRLPAIPVHFVVPHDVISIEEIFVESAQVRDRLPLDLQSTKILPFQYTSSENHTGVVVEDLTTYSNDTYWPEQVVELRSIGRMGAHLVASGVFHPVQYNPVANKIRVYENPTLAVRYNANEAQENTTGKAAGPMGSLVKRMALNPLDVDRFRDPSGLGPGCALRPEYDLLIVTAASAFEGSGDVVAAFHEYADARTRLGVRTYVVALEVPATADEVREVIEREACLTGVQQVLLGGVAYRPWKAEPEQDYPAIPAWAHTFDVVNLHQTLDDNLELQRITEQVSTDYDHALLSAAGVRDSYPDLIIGRLPVETVEDLSHLQSRISDYEQAVVSGFQTPDTFLNALLIGVDYDDPSGNPTTAQGDDVKRSTQQALSSNGFTTLVVEEEDQLTRERFLGALAGNQLEISDVLRGGIGYLNFAGAGHQWKGWISQDKDAGTSEHFAQGDLDEFSSKAHYFMFSLGSRHGDLDQGWMSASPGLSQIALTEAPQGPVGIIAESSRFLWIDPQGGASPGELVDFSFFRALATDRANPAERLNTAGALLYLAKTPLVPQAQADAAHSDTSGGGLLSIYNWTLRSQNLLADPSLTLWQALPTPLTVSHPDYIRSDAAMKVLVTKEDGTPLKGAAVSLYRSGAHWQRVVTDGSGAVEVQIPPLDEGPAVLTVRAPDHPVYVADLTVDNTPATLEALTSSTHPNSTIRYSARDVSLVWHATDENPIAGYSLLVDNGPSSDPGTTLTHTTNETLLTLPSDGRWYAHVRPMDSAGNWGDALHLELNADTTAPSVNVQLSGSGAWDPDDTWFRTPVEVALNVTDQWQGIDVLDWTAYRTLDAEAEAEYTGPFTVETVGPHVIAYRAEDGANPPNEQATQTISFGIDQSPPVAANLNHPNESKLEDNFTVSWSVTDDRSGAYRYWIDYSQDGGNWTAWLVNVTDLESTFPGVPGSSYAFRLIAADRAGNIMQEHAVSRGTTYVNLAPVADAGEDKRVAYETNKLIGVKFDGTESYDLDGSVEAYRWDFGDGTSGSTAPKATHIYDEPGTYNVTLWVTDDDGRGGTDEALARIVVEVGEVTAD